MGKVLVELASFSLVLVSQHNPYREQVCQAVFSNKVGFRKLEVYRKYYLKTCKGILYLGIKSVDCLYTNILNACKIVSKYQNGIMVKL